MVKTSFQAGAISIPEMAFGYLNKKRGITVHQTGNTATGADAKRHADLQTNGYGINATASWHWQVDDTEAIQSYDHSLSLYHASDGEGEGNLNTIAIEACINADGDYNKTIQNLAELIAHICKLEGLDPKKDVYQHHDFARDGKNCPTQIRAGKNGYTWEVLLDMAQKAFDGEGVAEVTPAKATTAETATTGIVKDYKETGTFTADRTINVRTAPNSGATIRTQYKAGESVKYHHVYIGNGYVWIEYISTSGVASYMAIRDYDNGTYGQLWGTLDGAKVSVTAEAPASTGIVNSYKENGTFYPNDTIIVRDKPSTKGAIIAHYYNGEKVKYNAVHVGNGYVWLQYKRANGKDGYIPCREYDGSFGKLWGTIK